MLVNPLINALLGKDQNIVTDMAGEDSLILDLTNLVSIYFS